MVKSIFKRIIVAVSVAIILMLLKGSLISNVSALEVKTFSTSDNSNFASCSNCNVIDSAWNFDSGLHNVSGNLLLNIMVYTDTANGSYLTTLTRTRITIDGVQYTCSVNGYGAPYSVANSGGLQKMITTYSLTCPVKFGTNGRFERIYIQTNGYVGGISFYSPFTFSYENGNQEVINSINSNTQAIEDTNDILNNNDVSNDTNTSIDNVFTFGTEEETFGPVADLLLLPLTLFRALYSGFNNSCSTYNLGSLFGTQLSLPCINIRNILGNQLYNFIDMAISIFMILNIILFCIDIFDRLTSFEDPFNDLYSPKHTYHGRHENGGAYHG